MIKGFLDINELGLQLNSNTSANQEYLDEEGQAINLLGEIKPLNIFVGANNSGKSRLMRAIFQYKSYSILPEAHFLEDFEEVVENLKKSIGNYSIPDHQYNRNIRQDTLDKDYQEISDKILKKEKAETAKFLHALDLLIKSAIDVNTSIIGKARKIVNLISQIKYIQPPQRIYIPLLRSAHTFYDTDYQDGQIGNVYQEDIFKNTIRQLYKFKESESEQFQIFTGRNLYDDLKNSLLNSNDEREKVKNFQDFISEAFFNKENITITPWEKTKHIAFFWSGSKKERELHHVGDGIQAIMILTYKIFTAQDNSWIFIEEPEINLHPAYQRIFLKLITENKIIKKKKLTIFFTTHSNHLLDLTITETNQENIAIFLFESKDRTLKKIRQVNSIDLKLLDSLGVHNSSVFMANCSIWVEGISDRIYIRNYLEAYIKYSGEENFKEDLHFSFFEYAGSNLEHYNFDESNLNGANINARFIATRIMVIADQDDKKEKKHEGFKKYLKDNYYVLPVREVENLWKGSYLKEKVSITFNKIKKNQLNNLELNEEDYKNIYLRNYLLQKFEEINKTVKKEDRINIPSSIKTDKQESFKAGIKTNLANATNAIEWKDMSKYAQNLTQKIYNFIKENNQ